MTGKVIAENIVRQRDTLDSRCKIRRFETSYSIEKDVTHEGAGEYQKCRVRELTTDGSSEEDADSPEE